jgi:cytochrome P450
MRSTVPRVGVGPDLACIESVRDPAGYFAGFRDRGQVQWSDAQQGWAVIGHAAVAGAFRDAAALSADRIGPLERIAAERPEGFGAVVDLLRGWMIFRDPPAHTRLREPVRAAFTPRRVTGLESVVASIVDEVLDTLAASGGAVDLSVGFAQPIPALVIAALLGVEASERHRFQDWSHELAAIVFSTNAGSVDTDMTVHAAEEFTTFFGELVAHERDAPTGGIITAIAQIEDSDLGDAELVGLCTLLLFAGHETTTTLLGNAIAILCQSPDMCEQLRGDPGLWPSAVEEFMRVQGPARTMVRKVAIDHEREGVQLRARDNVFLSIAAANHDPAVFAEPNVLDLARDPNPHLGFGWGLHHCLGASLARMEARIALARLVERFGRLEAAKAIPPLAGNLMGFGRRPLFVHLGA